MRIDPSTVYNQFKKTVSKSDEQALVRGGKIQLSKGQVIKGEIVDLQQGGAKIKLSSGQILEAKVLGDFQFSIGDTVQFIVKDENPGTIVLTPDATANEQFASKLLNILASAGLPDTEENKTLVNELLRNNLPIDSKALKEMITLVKQYPQATMKQLVFMVKHNIEVNATNVNQLILLERGEQPLLRSIASLTQDITQSTMGSKNEAQLLEFISGDVKAMDFLKGLSKVMDVIQNPGQHSDGAEKIENLTKNADELNNNILKSTTLAKDNNLSIVETNNQGTENNVAKVTGQKYDSLETTMNTMKETLDIPIKSMILSSDATALNDTLVKSAGFILDQDTTVNDLLNFVKEGLVKPEQLRDFLVILKEQSTYMTIAKGLLATKNTLNHIDDLKEYYVNLHDKVSKLIADTANLTEGSGHTKEAVNVKASVEFMSALNQDYNFLHLPLLLNDQILGSELYVHNNKKQVKDQDTVTALIRLDLLNLGHTDIYVKKTAKNVDVTFYMEDESQIEVVRSAISVLHKALMEKGFNTMGLKVASIQDGFDVTKDFFTQKDNHSELKRVTFDMRA